MRPCGSFSSCAVRLWDFQGLLWIHRLRRLQSVANPSLLKVAATRKKVVALCAKDSTWHPSSIEQVGTWIRTHHPKKTSSWLRLGANMPKQKTKENIALSLHARLYHFKCACQTRWCFPLVTLIEVLPAGARWDLWASWASWASVSVSGCHCVARLLGNLDSLRTWPATFKATLFLLMDVLRSEKTGTDESQRYPNTGKIFTYIYIIIYIYIYISLNIFNK